MSRTRRGAYAIEFALTLPIWFAVTMAIADFSWVAYQRAILASAGEQACRAAARLDPANDDSNLGALDTVADAVLADALSAAGDPVCAGCGVTVTVEGGPPERRLRCVATRTQVPFTDLFLAETASTSTHVVFLAWQTEAAP